jgi:hypothetical protein
LKLAGVREPVSREVGKLLGLQVCHVITIGTLFNAKDDYTNVGWLFRLLACAFASK